MSFDLTGPRWGWVNLDPKMTALDLLSAGSKSAWDGYPRVRLEASIAGDSVVLAGEVRPAEGRPAQRLVVRTQGQKLERVEGPVTADLKNDAGAAWGKMSIDDRSLTVTDGDGRLRLEITAFRDDKVPDGAVFLLAGGKPRFTVRVLDASGVAAAPHSLIEP